MKPVAAVFYRDYRQRLTNVGFVFWDLCAPLAYLLLFGVGFERMMGPGSGGAEPSYTAFLLPGVLAMVTFSVALNTSWGFFMDKDSGIFDELLTYPLTRPQLLVGKILFNVLLALIGSTLVVAVGAGVLHIPLRLALLPLAALVVAVATGGWFFFFSALAISLKRMDAFNTATSIAYIFLMFVSTMFYPLEAMPRWFRAAAYLNPLTWQVDVLRFALLAPGSGAEGGPTGGALVAEAAALVVFTLVCLVAAVRAIERAA